MKNMTRLLPVLALTAAIAALQACSPGGSKPVTPEHGPMGSTATPSTASLPGRNSESTPVERPE